MVNGVLVVWQPFVTAYQGLTQQLVELRGISVGDDAKIVPLEEPHPKRFTMTFGYLFRAAGAALFSIANRQSCGSVTKEPIGIPVRV